jgi:branched-chain amino acid transport system substrate-binding protein
MARVTRARALLLLTLAACTSAVSAAKPAIRIGALYPQAGPLAHYGSEELRGVRVAVDLFNARGGVRGRDVVLDVGKSDTVADAWRSAFLMARRGVPAILGTYSSTISLAASEAAHRNHVVYWETGAVADLVTARGYDEVFRLGPSGATLAAQAADFATRVLGPRFAIPTNRLRIAVAYENDPYGSSVGDGIRREASAKGFRLVGSYPYDPEYESFAGIIRALARVKPDIVVAASYLHDGARFREALVKAHLPTVKAMIGKCAAFYTAEMAKLLGAKLDGVFVADKPMDVAPSALTPEGLALERDFVDAFKKRFGTAPEAAAYMGFSGAWALFEGALSHARSFDAKGIEAAARAIDMAWGSLPNGAGVRFAGPGDAMEGQNERAFGVVWQWQDGKPVIVWPRSAARGAPLLRSR